MLKYILFTAGSVLFINTAKCQNRDTAIIYFKYNLKGYQKVNTLDSADFFRIILPPDSADNRVNIKEFYKDGKPKLVGKYDSDYISTRNTLLSGVCITYFSNGKRSSIIDYKRGEKDGNEYLFYPNGLLYCYIKNHIDDYTFKSFYWECYDSNGAIICQTGNGQWVTYDKEFKNILVRGQIKNGLKEGEWHGRTGDADSIKYLYLYHKDNIISATGYDKSGKSYPFKEVGEAANYKGGPITFIKIFKSYLKLPQDQNESKISLDTVHISFIVEKDGLVTDFKTQGYVNIELTNALKNAMDKCPDWLPSLYYGIPLRTRIFLPIAFIHGYTGSSKYDRYREEVFLREQILGF